MRGVVWVVLWGLTGGAALAEGVTRSPVPVPRPAPVSEPVSAAAPAPTDAPVVAAVDPGLGASLTRVPFPRPRPGSVPASAPADAEQAAPAVAEAAVAPKGLFARLLKPKARPEGLADRPEVETKAAVRARQSKKAVQSKKGSVCGDPAIKGETLSPITAKVKGCGVPDPVRVTSVAGVRLSQAATIDCPTARALKAWVEQGVQPAFGRNEVVELKIAAHYICRTRNNKKGAKISEHGRGKAVDVSGFVMADGTEWSVSRNYNKTIRRAHKAACGIFGTTLGPGSDGYHEDHLHFDTAAQRNGPYCR